MLSLSQNARFALKRRLATEEKNAALLAMGEALLAGRETLLTANSRDMAAGQAAGLSESLLDRLLLTPERLESMAEGLRQVAALPDPVGEVLEEFTAPSGLRVKKVRVPMGVIGMIYEARPNVTTDAAALCLKAGSAVILRGGKEAVHSNAALVEILRKALADKGLPQDYVQFVADTSRASAQAMMHAKGQLDLLIPRGGAGLIQAVTREATVPVIETGAGVCHVYVDAAADLPMAAAIVHNGKTSRPSVCNAVETMLVHTTVAAEFLPMAAQRLAGVELRGCPQTCNLLPQAKPAVEKDYFTEYGDLILNCRLVDSLEEAVDWVNAHGTKHSECIVTGDAAAAERFFQGVDAAAVYHNASTRFTDGFEFGLGAEIGISTQKTHPRGPMGLREICSYQYAISGNGQIR